MNITIDRSIWRCGGNGKFRHGAGITSLLNSEGFMCCIGQACTQLGVEKELLFDKAVPAELSKHIDFLTSVTVIYGRKYDSQLTKSAMSINDDEELTPQEREKELVALFDRYGHTLAFTGEFQ